MRYRIFLAGFGLVALSGCATGDAGGGESKDDQTNGRSSLMLTAACGGDWVRTPAGDSFSFCLPPGMEKQPGTGVDSFVASYWNARIHFSFDYGWYSDPLKYYSEYPEYREESVEMAGKTAKLISYDQAETEFGYKTAVYWEDVGVDDKTHLGMWAHCKTPEDRDEAREIFASTILATP